MKITTITVRGRKIDVDVDSNGDFSAKYNEQEVEAKTLELLREKLERVTKNDKIEPIPFIQWDGSDEVLRSGKCTGIHIGNHNMLVKWEGEKGVAQCWRLEGTIAPEHFAEYNKLCDAVIAAEAQRNAFEVQHAFSIKERIEKAMKGDES